MHITVLFVFLMFCCITCGNFEEVGQGDKTQTLPNTGQTGTRPKRGERLPNYPKTGALPKGQHRSSDYWAGDTLGDETSTSSGIDPVVYKATKVEKRGVYDILTQEGNFEQVVQGDKTQTLPNTGKTGTRPKRGERLPNYPKTGTLPKGQHRSSDYWAGDTLGDETSTSSGIDPVVYKATKVEKRGVYDILPQEGNFEQVVQGDKTQTLPNTGKTGTRPKRGERLPNYPKTGTLLKGQHRSSDYWAGDTLGDETSTSSGIDPVVYKATKVEKRGVYDILTQEGNFEQVVQGDKTQTLPNTGKTGTRPKRGERLPNYPKTGTLPKGQHRSSDYWAGDTLGDETSTSSGIDPVVYKATKVEKRDVYDILPQEELSVDIAFQADKGGTLPNTGSRGTRPGRNRLPNYTRWGTLPNQLEVKDHPEQDLLGLLLHSNETLPVKS